MHRFTQQAVMLLTLLTLAPAVMADRTYNLQSGQSMPVGWTLSGNITTDGTIGTIQATNILSWTWTMTSGASSFTVSSTDPGASAWTSTGITSTGAALLVPYLGSIGFDGPGGALMWYTNMNDQTSWGVSTTQAITGGYGGLPWNSSVWWNGQGDPETGGQIASAAPVAVPEPSPLSIAGFGALCGCVHVMRHKRRARRTATTGA